MAAPLVFGRLLPATAAADVNPRVWRADIRHVLFVPGIARFDTAGVPKWYMQYFTEKLLASLRSEVDIVPRVASRQDYPWSGPLVLRAAALQRQLLAFAHQHRRDLNDEGIHVLGHSMGGLDARCMLLRAHEAVNGDDSSQATTEEKANARDVLSLVTRLTTVATPHLGSSLADRSNSFVSKGAFMAASLGGWIDTRGFDDLIPSACDVFNQRAAAFETAVFLQPLRDAEASHTTAVSTTDPQPQRVVPLKRPLLRTYACAMDPHRQLRPLRYLMKLNMRLHANVRDEFDGQHHDGMVSLPSAAFDEVYFRGRIEADHASVLGNYHKGHYPETRAQFDRRLTRCFVNMCKKDDDTDDAVFVR